VRDAIAVALALVVGVFLASYDLRTDDTGIEVGLLLIASVTLAAVAPKRWWLIAICVGLPIPITSRSPSRIRHSRPRACSPSH
jgi:hypothetical protein